MAQGQQVILHHKEFLGLEVGPDRDTGIIFGPRSGNLPGYATVDEDHPLLPALLQDPNVEVVDDLLGTKKSYVSPIEPGREFKSETALLAHVRAAAKKGDPLATAYLERFTGTEEPADDGGVHTSPNSNVVQQDAPSPPVKPTFGA
jgi:hypothetical protein